MKIENGKMIFEVVTCWDCQGNKQVTKGITCPLWGKIVKHLPLGRCPHCKSKNRHSHKIVGTTTETCSTCEGVGTRLEDAYDFVKADVWATMVPLFKWTIQRVHRYGTFVESYIGGDGSLYGCTDYGRTAALTDEQILAQVPKDSTPSQPVQWIKKDTFEVPPELVIEVRTDGYAVRPCWR